MNDFRMYVVESLLKLALFVAPKNKDGLLLAIYVGSYAAKKLERQERI